MRELLARHDKLAHWTEYTAPPHAIPVVKVTQWALEGNSLDAASMADLASPKRSTVVSALIRQRLAQVTDDLCEIRCKQMSRVIHAGEDALQQYLSNSQGKTDEIMRRFASLETLLNSADPSDAQLQAVRKTVRSGQIYANSPDFTPSMAARMSVFYGTLLQVPSRRVVAHSDTAAIRCNQSRYWLRAFACPHAPPACATQRVDRAQSELGYPPEPARPRMGAVAMVEADHRRKPAGITDAPSSSPVRDVRMHADDPRAQIR
ncbi:hypothetical protein [Robbsia andropogonis]|uniref:hypothetical protein n=1 Tax=Robbsia andropogonis TaxID=28092 RepID=UPI00209F6E80|nr:hypothetical protein [Robbsia andropogonis]MCP1121569.1 hypothetical protein [Robbsia andropogonis]